MAYLFILLIILLIKKDKLFRRDISMKNSSTLYACIKIICFLTIPVMHAMQQQIPTSLRTKMENLMKQLDELPLPWYRMPLKYASQSMTQKEWESMALKNQAEWKAIHYKQPLKQVRDLIQELNQAKLYAEIQQIQKRWVQRRVDMDPKFIELPPDKKESPEEREQFIKKIFQKIIRTKDPLEAREASIFLGAYPDLANTIFSNGTTPLMSAARGNKIPMTIFLINIRDINLDAQDEHGWTALIYAAYHGNFEIIKQLIAAGANTEIKSKNSKKTAFDFATEKQKGNIYAQAAHEGKEIYQQKISWKNKCHKETAEQLHGINDLANLTIEYAFDPRKPLPKEEKEAEEKKVEDNEPEEKEATTPEQPVIQIPKKRRCIVQ